MKEIDRIDGILRKLLNASNRPKFEISDVLIDQVIDNILEVFTPQIELHKLKLEKDYQRIPPAIKADPSELEQIFTNLFLNSIHEMPLNGTLKVQLTRSSRPTVAEQASVCRWCSVS